MTAKAQPATVLAMMTAAFLAFGLFSQTVHNSSHNEQMYVTAAYLMVQGKHLYQDFAFVQMPYSPQIYALVYRITGAGYFLFKAKLVNYGFLAAATLLLGAIVRRSARDARLTGAVLVLFLSNYYITRATIEASNYTMPMAFSLASYYLFICYGEPSGTESNKGTDNQPDLPPRRRKARRLACLLAGISLAAAIGAKLYYISLLAPFGVAALLYPQEEKLRRRIANGLAPLAAGVVIGLLPVCYYVVRNFNQFYFNNLGYHLLNALWREQNGFTDTMTWASKLDTARDLLANPDYLLVVMWLGLALAVFAGQHGRTAWRRLTAIPLGVFLSGALVIVAMVTAFTPKPLFPQYFAMPVPYLLTWMAALYATVADQRRILWQGALIAAALSTIIILPRHTNSLRSFFSPHDQWSGAAAVNVSREIRTALQKAGYLNGNQGSDKVATLSPIFAIETGLSIYPQLATGSFVYRIGDLLSETQRRADVATSVSTITHLFDADPPAAIFVTDEGDLEAPLADYAKTHHYRAAEQKFAEGQLYIR